MGSYADAEVPVIVRGDGCYVYDEHGKRYLDGLSALYCVNIGHGRAELGEAAAGQAEELGFYTNWSYAHPRSIELATRIAELAPGNLNRVFFTSGGSESVESAWKLAKAYHAARGEPQAAQAHLPLARLPRHLDGRAHRHRPAGPARAVRAADAGRHGTSANTNSYRWKEDRDPLWAADSIEEAIVFEGPETVAAVILEPVQNGGGCFVPQDGYFQRVREICDRHGVLLISDEVICSWGRLGHWFGCERYGYQPGHDHDREGHHLGLCADGRGDRRRPHRRAVPARQGDLQPRLHLRRAPDRVRGGAGQHRRDRARGSVRARARRTRAACARCSRACATCRSSATCAAPATSTRSSWSRTRTRRRRSTHEEAEELLRGFLSGELYRRGLICRTDDRGDPIVQLSPPLIAGRGAVRGDRGDPAPGAERGVGADGDDGAHCREPDRRARAGARLAARSPRRRTCAGCTAPSWPTRRRG